MDGTGTIATDDRFDKLKETLAASQQETPATNGTADDEDQEASATGFDDEAGPINENLFLDEDLDGLDDELNELDVNWAYLLPMACYIHFLKTEIKLAKQKFSSTLSAYVNVRYALRVSDSFKIFSHF